MNDDGMLGEIETTMSNEMIHKSTTPTIPRGFLWTPSPLPAFMNSFHIPAVDDKILLWHWFSSLRQQSPEIGRALRK